MREDVRKFVVGLKELYVRVCIFGSMNHSCNKFLKGEEGTMGGGVSVNFTGINGGDDRRLKEGNAGFVVTTGTIHVTYVVPDFRHT